MLHTRCLCCCAIALFSDGSVVRCQSSAPRSKQMPTSTPDDEPRWMVTDFEFASAFVMYDIANRLEPFGPGFALTADWRKQRRAMANQ
jgi:hypothetical protein